MNRPVLLVAACATGLLAGGVAYAANAPSEPTELGQLCERVRPAFVFVGGGSGVVVSPDGLILTNAHVIGNQQQFNVRLGSGQRFEAELLGKDVPGDLAVLRLQNKSGKKIPHLELGDPDQLRLGDRVLAIGNPVGKGFMDLEPSFSTGVISGLDLLFRGGYPDAVVTDAPVNPGNSGGPLVNMRGQVVGIVGQLRTRWGLRSNTGLGFAISTRRIAVWLPRLRDSGKKEIRHGSIRGWTFEQSDGGTLISRPRLESVADGSHAAKCGFQKGDVITAVEKIPVTTVARVAGLIALYPEGHELAVEIEREGKAQTITAKLVGPVDLGIELAKPGKKDEYVRIAKVEDSSPAKEAGAEVGDEIVAVGGARLKGPVANQYVGLGLLLKRRIYMGDAFVITVRRKNDKGAYDEHELRLEAK
jgi:serine protease Do